MKVLKYLPIVLSAMVFDAHGEMILATPLGDYNTHIQSGTSKQACQKFIFMTFNTGSLVTGLTSSNLHILVAKQYGPTKPLSILRSLTATSEPGIYNICVTPNGFTWASPSSSTNYAVDFLISTTTDNGVIKMHLLNY